MGGLDYPQTYQDFRSWFPDDVSCREYLGQLRWPNGFTCPRCGLGDSWRTGQGLWMCAGCGVKTSVTAGTIFHRSHTPLSTWFAALWFVTSQKNGVSAQGLQDALGFGSYETAWAWLHKLRRAMVRPDRELLSGNVELDQSFLGGRSTGRQGGSSDKAAITIAVERSDNGRLGRVRLKVADRPGGLDMIEFASEAITPGSTIHTDGARVFKRLVAKGYDHQPTPGYKAVDLDAVMAGPHLISSLLKRWTAGTLHYRVSPQHLPYYLDEFTFRFNRRTSKARGLLFYRLLQQAVDTDPHPLKDLIGG
ncbi:MAG: IS1595 family transposase [Actinomycetota bacterium]|nr:IS1595 family transposase [Actinomycetota bacterium]